MYVSIIELGSMYYFNDQGESSFLIGGTWVAWCKAKTCVCWSWDIIMFMLNMAVLSTSTGMVA